MCLYKLLFVLKEKPQVTQGYGRSPVCDRICFSKTLGLAQARLQKELAGSDVAWPACVCLWGYLGLCSFLKTTGTFLQAFSSISWCVHLRALRRCAFLRRCTRQ
uniref:Uncharacterized protein n=1 Tax=Eptatretus burgeri TaxID=7764 RepID=A0A8C4R2D5_EPTBU